MAGYQASAGFVVPGFGAGTMDVPPRLAHPQHSGSESHAGPGLPLSGNIYVPYEEPSPPDTIGSSNYTTDQFEVPPAKRQRLSGPSGAGTGLDTHPRTALPSLPDAEFMADTSGKGSRVAKGQNAAPAAAKKAQRKRSGCLTCRDRHISCDEDFAPECGNCRKSSRACIRGTRLNFHQIEVQAPPYLLPRSPGWTGALPLFFLSFPFFSFPFLSFPFSPFLSFPPFSTPNSAGLGTGEVSLQLTEYAAQSASRTNPRP